uniref:p53 and DNA damage-regulated protein 1 n=1 Tax=Culicoides sonorensis TaxID=179676 RepID=A0A336KXV9_CULSO
MWFEVLPSAGVIFVMMAIPGYALYGLHKLGLGNTEKIGDKILANKKKLVDLSQNSEDTREAIRELRKCPDENKAWISCSGMMIKMPKENAMKLLKKDQTTLENEIKDIHSENKLLVHRSRDLEKSSPKTAFDLKPLSHKEIQGFRQNLPNF